MKRVFWFFVLMTLLPGLVWAQEGRDDRGEGHGHGRPRVRQARPARVRANHVRVNRSVSPQFKNMGVHSYPKPLGAKVMVTERAHSNIVVPSRGVGGVAIHANVIARTNFSNNVVVRNHMAVITAPAFRTNIVNYCAHETVVNHYYWHSYGGFNYCHYYDPWGYHWYGWYIGNNYFWTRWYNNHYWWYDPTYYRWCYWHDGGWWWEDPGTTTVYVYNNGNYVSANGGAAPAASSKPAPAANVQSADYFSPDSTREVRVLAGGDTFLYDISGNNAFKPIFLATGVNDVKFSKGNGAELQILLILKDGTFSTFDGEGNSLSGSSSNAAPPAADVSASDDTDQTAPRPDSSSPQPPPTGANPPPAPAQQ